ncbi:MAG: hypothetical protein HN977_19735, partial [Gammaproteobacteria bacterium]|nr:hypothetical protein [Gammaproteobacteria bacterium]
FQPWVSECPLHYTSPNAPEKIDVLGSLFLSILSGHRRYAHITNLMSDRVNSVLLGMSTKSRPHEGKPLVMTLLAEV